MPVLNMVASGGGSGGYDTSDATATASDILQGKTAYGANGKLTGTIPTVNQANPAITVSSSGLITATTNQSGGYVAEGTRSATRQLSTQSGRTITPGTSQQTAVASGRYTTGNVNVAGSANLVSSNIRQGVNIFGVTGTAQALGNPVSIGITIEANFTGHIAIFTDQGKTRISNSGYFDSVKCSEGSCICIYGYYFTEGTLSEIMYIDDTAQLNDLVEIGSEFDAGEVGEYGGDVVFFKCTGPNPSLRLFTRDG